NVPKIVLIPGLRFFTESSYLTFSMIFLSTFLVIMCGRKIELSFVLLVVPLHGKSKFILLMTPSEFLMKIPRYRLLMARISLVTELLLCAQPLFNRMMNVRKHVDKARKWRWTKYWDLGLKEDKTFQLEDDLSVHLIVDAD